MLRILRTAAIFTLLFLAAMGAALVLTIPAANCDCTERAESHYMDDEGNYLGPSNIYCWICPEASDRLTGREVSFDLSEDDELWSSFRDNFERSMDRDKMRTLNLLNPDPWSFVVVDDYVRYFADRIIQETEGCGDAVRITAALWFVQRSITYTTDLMLYGIDEYVAYPSETLYLHRGDCEDKAILFCSLMEAMGYRSVILDFVGHVAAAVLLDEGRGTYYPLSGGDYCYCEAASDHITLIGDIGQRYSSEVPRIWHRSDSVPFLDCMQHTLAAYRNAIRRTVGV